MWKISGATVQGLGHEENNIPCQDKIYSLRENGVTAIALADGAGSAKLSHYGAEEAVKAVCEKLCADFRVLLGIRDVVAAKREIISAVTSRLESLASKMYCAIDDLASTLIAAASDDEYVLLMHIGDGIAGYFRDGNLSVASYPDNGEYKNETVFTISPDALPRMRLSKGKAEGISGFVLMSDGTAESFYDRKEKKFVPLTDEIKQRCVICPEETSDKDLHGLFHDVVRFRETRDDCGIIIMCRPDSYFAGLRDLPEAERAGVLGARTLDGALNREKLLCIFGDGEYATRSEIMSRGCDMGLKRKQVAGLLRDMDRKGLVERVHPRVYRLRLKY